MEEPGEAQEMVLSKIEEVGSEGYLSVEERVVLVEEGEDDGNVEEQVLGYLEVQPSQLQAVTEGGTIYLSSEGLDLDNQHLILAQGEEGGEYIVVVGSEEEALAALSSAEGGLKLQQALQQHKEEQLLKSQQEALLQNGGQQAVQLDCQEVSSQMALEESPRVVDLDPEFQGLGSSEVEMSQYETVQVSEDQTVHVSELKKSDQGLEIEDEAIESSENMSELETGHTYIVEMEQEHEVQPDETCLQVGNGQMSEIQTDEICKEDFVETSEPMDVEIGGHESGEVVEHETLHRSSVANVQHVVDDSNEPQVSLQEGEQNIIEFTVTDTNCAISSENEFINPVAVEKVEATNLESRKLESVAHELELCKHNTSSELMSSTQVTHELSKVIESEQLELSHVSRTDIVLMAKPGADVQKKSKTSETIDFADTINNELEAQAGLRDKSKQAGEKIATRVTKILPLQEVVDLDGESVKEHKKSGRDQTTEKHVRNECEVVDLEIEEDEKLSRQNNTEVVVTSSECEVVDLESDSEEQLLNDSLSIPGTAKNSIKDLEVSPVGLFPHGLNQLVEVAINISSPEPSSKLETPVVKETCRPTPTDTGEMQVSDQNVSVSEDRKRSLSLTTIDSQDDIIFEKVVTHKTSSKSVSVIKQTPKEHTLKVEKVINSKSTTTTVRETICEDVQLCETNSRNQEEPIVEVIKRTVIQVTPKEIEPLNNAKELTAQGSHEKKHLTSESLNTEKVSPSKRNIRSPKVGESERLTSMACKDFKKADYDDSKKEDSSLLKQNQLPNKIKDSSFSKDQRKLPDSPHKLQGSHIPEKSHHGSKISPELKMCRPAIVRLTRADEPKQTSLSKKDSPNMKDNSADSHKERMGSKAERTAKSKDILTSNAETSKVYPKRSSGRQEKSSLPVAANVSPGSTNFKAQQESQSVSILKAGNKTDEREPIASKTKVSPNIIVCRSKSLEDRESPVSMKTRSGSPKVTDVKAPKLEEPKTLTQPVKTTKSLKSNINFATRNLENFSGKQTTGIEIRSDTQESAEISVNIKTRGSSPKIMSKSKLEPSPEIVDDSISSVAKQGLFKSEEISLIVQDIIPAAEQPSSKDVCDVNVESIKIQEVINTIRTRSGSPKVSDVKARRTGSTSVEQISSTKARESSPKVVGKGVTDKLNEDSPESDDFSCDQEQYAVTVDLSLDKGKSQQPEVIDSPVSVRTRGGRRSSIVSKKEQQGAVSDTFTKTPETKRAVDREKIKSSHKSVNPGDSNDQQDIKLLKTKETLFTGNRSKTRQSKGETSTVSTYKKGVKIDEEKHESRIETERMPNDQTDDDKQENESIPKSTETQIEESEEKLIKSKKRGRISKSDKAAIDSPDASNNELIQDKDKLGDQKKTNEGNEDHRSRVRTRSTPKAVESKPKDSGFLTPDIPKDDMLLENEQETSTTSRGRPRGISKPKSDKLQTDYKQKALPDSKASTVRTRRSMSNVAKISSVSTKVTLDIDASRASPRLEDPQEERTKDSASKLKTRQTTQKSSDEKIIDKIEVKTGGDLKKDSSTSEVPNNTEKGDLLHLRTRRGSPVVISGKDKGHPKASVSENSTSPVIEKSSDTSSETCKPISQVPPFEQESSSLVEMATLKELTEAPKECFSQADSSSLEKPNLSNVAAIKIFSSKNVRIPNLRRNLKLSEEKDLGGPSMKKETVLEDAFAFTEEDFGDTETEASVPSRVTVTETKVASAAIANETEFVSGVIETETKLVSNKSEDDDEPEIPPLSVRIGIGRTYSKASPLTVSLDEADEESLEISFKHLEEEVNVAETVDCPGVIPPSDEAQSSSVGATKSINIKLHKEEKTVPESIPVVKSSRLKEKAARRNSLNAKPDASVNSASKTTDPGPATASEKFEQNMPTFSMEERKQQHEKEEKELPNLDVQVTPSERPKRKSSELSGKKLGSFKRKSKELSVEKASLKISKNKISSEKKTNTKAASEESLQVSEEGNKQSSDFVPISVEETSKDQETEKRIVKRRALSQGSGREISPSKKAKRVSFGARGQPVKTADQRFDDLMNSTPTKSAMKISFPSKITAKRKRSLSASVLARKVSISPKRKLTAGPTPPSGSSIKSKHVRRACKVSLGSTNNSSVQSEDSSDEEAMSLNVLRTYSGGKASPSRRNADGSPSPAKRSKNSTIKAKGATQVDPSSPWSTSGDSEAAVGVQTSPQKSKCQFHICCQGPSPPELRSPTSSYVCRECHYRTPRIENIILHYKECSTLMPNLDMLGWEKVGDKTPTRFSQEPVKATPSSKKVTARKNLSKHLSGSSQKVPSAHNRNSGENSPGDERILGDREMSDPLDSDDSVEHPVADQNWKNTFGFVENDIVWADWKNDQWPALVRKIYLKQKKVSVCFIENQLPEKGMKIHARKLTPFDDAARNKQFLRKGGPNSLKVKAVQKAEDYLRKRILGMKIKPLPFFNNPDESIGYLSGGDDSDEEAATVATREGSPLDSSSMPLDSGHPEEDTRSRAPEEEDGRGRSFPSRSLSAEEMDRIKDRLKEQNIRLLNFIKKGNLETHLLDVFHERTSSERHQKFHSEVPSVRNQLKHSTWFGPLDSEDLRDDIIEYCMGLFKEKCDKQDSFDIVAYVFEVWIPEALIQALMRLHSLSEKEAEARFARGSEWLPQDLLLHQEAEELIRDPGPLDPLTSKRQKVLEKLRAIGIQEELLQAVTPLAAATSSLLPSATAPLGQRLA